MSAEAKAARPTDSAQTTDKAMGAPRAARAPSAVAAWYAVGFLTVLASLSTIDRQVIALMIGPIRRDLAISDTQIGLLGGLAFSMLYAVCTLPWAWVADRRSRKRVISVAVFLWSLASAACGLATGYVGLFLGRMAVGVGEAGLAPAAYSYMSDLVPRRSLPVAIGVFSAAPFLGVGLANILGGALVQHFEARPPVVLPLLGHVSSWQLTFFIVGLPGVLLALLAVLTLREPVRREVDGKAAIPLTWREVRAFLRDARLFLALMFTAYVALSIQGWALFFWAIEFFVRHHGMSHARIGMIYGLMTMILGFIGAYISGQVAVRFEARGRADATMRLTLLAVIALFPAAALMPWMPTAAGSLVLVGVMTFLMGWPGGLGTTALQLIAPNQLKARIISFYLFVVNTLSLTLGPYLGGLIGDQVFGGKSLGGSLTLMACVDYPLALLCLALAQKPFRRALERAGASG